MRTTKRCDCDSAGMLLQQKRGPLTLQFDGGWEKNVRRNAVTNLSANECSDRDRRQQEGHKETKIAKEPPTDLVLEMHGLPLKYRLSSFKSHNTYL